MIEAAPAATGAIAGAQPGAAAGSSQSAAVAVPPGDPVAAPGVASDAPVEAAPATPASDGASDARSGAWLLLALIAGGALAGAAAHRTLAIVRARRD